MRRTYHRWHSPVLQRDMELLVFGHAGARVLAFPPTRHPFYDWEDRGLVASLTGQLEGGQIQLFCLGSIYYDDNIYYNNPAEFLANEHDEARLAALRHLDIILAVGRDDPLLASNERLSALLWGKNIWHALRVWDGFAHDWPVWARMLPLYLGGHD